MLIRHFFELSGNIQFRDIVTKSKFTGGHILNIRPLSVRVTNTKSTDS